MNVSNYTPYHKIPKISSENGVDQAEKEHPEDDTIFDDIPYSISPDEYLHTCTDYIKAQWTYFQSDDTFANEYDELIPDHEKYIGYRPETFFDLGTEGPIYIRNERLSMDFEILKNSGSYRVQVLGEDDE